jgi:hypothetical protein
MTAASGDKCVVAGRRSLFYERGVRGYAFDEVLGTRCLGLIEL